MFKILATDQFKKKYIIHNFMDKNAVWCELTSKCEPTTCWNVTPSSNCEVNCCSTSRCSIGHLIPAMWLVTYNRGGVHALLRHRTPFKIRLLKGTYEQVR